jgi:AcrR family transcriptional regulator
MSAPDDETRSPRRGRTRERLVAAAATVVAEQGFHTATVDAIAERAGYSIGALYGNFANKDELFLAVFDQHVLWFDELLASATDARDRADAATTWLRGLSKQPQQFLVFVEFWAYAVRQPKLKRELARRMRHMRQKVVAAAGESEEAALMGLLALAAARGLALEKIADPRAVPDTAASQAVVGLIS